MASLWELRTRLERRKGQRDQLEAIVADLKKQIRAAARDIRRLEMALEIVRQVGLATQRQLEFHLSEQVSLALEAVFDTPYALKVKFLEKRGKTEAELLFARDDMVFSPLGNAGGGAIDVAAFALRVAYLSMRLDKKIRPVLLLDEPFARLKGEDANRRALEMLQEVSHRLGLQIIVVSDERMPREDIAESVDAVFCVNRLKGSSNVRLLTDSLSASSAVEDRI